MERRLAIPTLLPTALPDPLMTLLRHPIPVTLPHLETLTASLRLPLLLLMTMCHIAMHSPLLQLQIPNRQLPTDDMTDDTPVTQPLRKKAVRRKCH